MDNFVIDPIHSYLICDNFFENRSRDLSCNYYKIGQKYPFHLGTVIGVVYCFAALRISYNNLVWNHGHVADGKLDQKTPG